MNLRLILILLIVSNFGKCCPVTIASSLGEEEVSAKECEVKAVKNTLEQDKEKNSVFRRKVRTRGIQVSGITVSKLSLLCQFYYADYTTPFIGYIEIIAPDKLKRLRAPPFFLRENDCLG